MIAYFFLNLLVHRFIYSEYFFLGHVTMNNVQKTHFLLEKINKRNLASTNIYIKQIFPTNVTTTTEKSYDPRHLRLPLYEFIVLFARVFSLFENFSYQRKQYDRQRRTCKTSFVWTRHKKKKGRRTV